MSEFRLHWAGGGSYPNWGLFGGGGWTGGSTIHDEFDAEPVDTVDEYFKEHDLGYYNAHFSDNEAAGKLRADAKLVSHLSAFVQTNEFQKLSLPERTYIQDALNFFGIKAGIGSVASLSLWDRIKLGMIFSDAIVHVSIDVARGANPNHKCFASGTEILLWDCTLPIEKVSVGHLARCFDAELGLSAMLV